MILDGCDHWCPKAMFDPIIPMTDPNGAAIYGVPWIPSIYPLYVSINIPAPWIRHWSIGVCHAIRIWSQGAGENLTVACLGTSGDPGFELNEAVVGSWRKMTHQKSYGPWMGHEIIIQTSINFHKLSFLLQIIQISLKVLWNSFECLLKHLPMTSWVIKCRFPEIP